MVLSDMDMLDLVRTLPIPSPWERGIFVQGIADMRGRPITLIATETVYLADRLCGLWLAREHDDVILYERGASEFRIDQVVCHQIGHMVLGHHSGARTQARGTRAESAWRRRLPDFAPELLNTVLDSRDYGDEQEHEADLFALLLMNAAEGKEHSMIRNTPSRTTAARSQQRARACTPPPTVADDLALVHGFTRQVKIACDDLHDEPFNPEARAQLVRLITRDSETADAANKRLHADAQNASSAREVAP